MTSRALASKHNNTKVDIILQKLFPHNSMGYQRA